MGLLWDTPEERLRKERDKERLGILGSASQDAIIAPLGSRMNVQLQGAQPGSGYLGSGKGVEDQANAMAGLLRAGYSPQEASGLLSAATEQQAEPTTLMQNLQAAGVDLASEEGQKTMLDALMKPQTQVNLGAGGAGAIWSKDQVKAAGLPDDAVVTQDRYGKPQILRAEKYTQPQILSGGFATRMATATEEIDNVMASGFDPAGIVQNIDMFGVPGIAANYARSPEGQRYRQAQENWITANLRKESGAAIPEAETEREIKKWFPQPGDSVAVIAQKARARKDAQRSMIKSAGGAYQELKDQAEKERLKELRAKHAK